MSARVSQALQDVTSADVNPLSTKLSNVHERPGQRYSQLFRQLVKYFKDFVEGKVKTAINAD